MGSSNLPALLTVWSCLIYALYLACSSAWTAYLRRDNRAAKWRAILASVGSVLVFAGDIAVLATRDVVTAATMLAIAEVIAIVASVGTLLYHWAKRTDWLFFLATSALGFAHALAFNLMVDGLWPLSGVATVVCAVSGLIVKSKRQQPHDTKPTDS